MEYVIKDGGLVLECLNNLAIHQTHALGPPMEVKYGPTNWIQWQTKEGILEVQYVVEASFMQQAAQEDVKIGHCKMNIFYPFVDFA